MTIEDNRPSRARQRAINSALFVSLAVNLLFVGGFATAAWTHRHDAPREPGLLGFVKELPVDRQEAARAEIAAARESMKDLRALVRTTWIDANTLLTAEPFDKEKFKTALVKLEDAEARYKLALYGALADTAEKLTPAERKLLQTWREKRRPKLLMRSEQGGDEPKPN